MTRPSATGYWIGFAIVLGLLVAAPLVLPEFWRRGGSAAFSSKVAVS